MQEQYRPDEIEATVQKHWLENIIIKSNFK